MPELCFYTSQDSLPSPKLLSRVGGTSWAILANQCAARIRQLAFADNYAVTYIQVGWEVVFRSGHIYMKDAYSAVLWKIYFPIFIFIYNLRWHTWLFKCVTDQNRSKIAKFTEKMRNELKLMKKSIFKFFLFLVFSAAPYRCCTPGRSMLLG